MYNSKNRFFIAAVLIIGAAAFYFLSKNQISIQDISLPDKKTDTPVVTDTQSIKTSADKPKPNLEEKSNSTHALITNSELSEFSSLSAEEKKSLLTLSLLLEEAVNGESSMDLLVRKLDDLKLVPIVMKDENAYTGTMNVVRTKETLPGTRYIHAQYFTGDNDNKFLQHMAFELRGSENSFAAAKKIIQKQFNITEKPTRETANFVSWKMLGRILWIKKFEAEDLKKETPFNSYDESKDIGTIRIVSEADPH